MGLERGTPSGCSDRERGITFQVLARRSWSWRLLSITEEKVERNPPNLAPNTRHPGAG